MEFLLELKDIAVLADMAGRVQGLGRKVSDAAAGSGREGVGLVVRFCLLAVLAPGLLGFRASEGERAEGLMVGLGGGSFRS
jgi:hypothetical protein